MFSLFFFNDTATTKIYTLSLHDALPICIGARPMVEEAKIQLREQFRLGLVQGVEGKAAGEFEARADVGDEGAPRSEEHTSELQSQSNLVCRLLLEKKKRRE